MNRNRIGNLLEAARLKAGLSQKQVADAVGIRQNMVSNYENGRRRLTRSMARRLADVLKVTPERFFKPKGKPDKSQDFLNLIGKITCLPLY